MTNDSPRRSSVSLCVGSGRMHKSGISHSDDATVATRTDGSDGWHPVFNNVKKFPHDLSSGHLHPSAAPASVACGCTSADHRDTALQFRHRVSAGGNYSSDKAPDERHNGVPGSSASNVTGTRSTEFFCVEKKCSLPGFLRRCIDGGYGWSTCKGNINPQCPCRGGWSCSRQET